LMHLASLIYQEVSDQKSHVPKSLNFDEETLNPNLILVGDLLLAHSSRRLARLQNHQATEIISSALSQLMEGEFRDVLQYQSQSCDLRQVLTKEAYTQKTYLKTVSLFSASCQSAAILSNSPSSVASALKRFGENFAFSYQLIREVIECNNEEYFNQIIASPSNLFTMPMIYAIEKDPSNLEFIRHFNGVEGKTNLKKMQSILLQTSAIEQTKQLASQYCEQALDALAVFPSSPSKQLLEELTQTILSLPNPLNSSFSQTQNLWAALSFRENDDPNK